ncbi:MAG TPA: hypothetical protein VMU21_03555 [Thermodesulfovibrionales bacterium]|nr:hypothetical protein [Thermodesulfovibrionales bacterium]
MGAVNTEQIIKRIHRLARSCPGLAHEFRFIAGAVFALNSAEKIGHKNRATYVNANRQHHVDELNELLKALSQGTAPPPQWEAGFYYNAAVMRIHASYERILKAILDPAKKVPQKKGVSRTEKWASKIEKDISAGPLARSHLESIREEINKLKHDLYGQDVTSAQKRNITDDLGNAWIALTELLNIMVDSNILPALTSRYSSLPKP